MTKLLFLLIFVIAFCMRVLFLDYSPPSLNWDEVSIGYNAYSILKTGKDEWGKVLPLSFQAYGDFKLPGYIYLDVPFIAVFGLTEWGVRIPSALLGLFTVVGIYLITKQLTGSKYIGLLSMFIASVTPWLIILSRIGLEANFALTLITFGFFFILKSTKDSKFLIFASICFSVALFTYNSSRVVIIPFLLLIGIYLKGFYRSNLSKFIIPLLIIIITFVIVIPHALLQDSSARYRWTTILDEGAINEINESRGSSQLPPFVNKLVHNKVTYWIPRASMNYISHFDPRFLFLNGGSNYQYSVPGNGLLHLFLFPFVIIGIRNIIRKRNPNVLLLFGWLLIAPLPAAITRDAPHSLRALFMIPPFIILSVYGLQELIAKMKLKILIVFIMIIGVIVQSVFFLKEYIGEYRSNYSWSWQYGYQQAVDYVNKQANLYDRIVITKKYGEPHEFFLFYTKFNPNQYLSNSEVNRYHRSDWYWVDKIGKYEFMNDWEIKDNLKSVHNVLLVTSPGNYPNNGEVLKTIYFLNNTPAFDIVRL